MPTAEKVIYCSIQKKRNMAKPNRVSNRTAPSGSGLRIAAFGFRSYPPREGSAGADKFAYELLPRLAKRGHEVVAYNRVYPGAPLQSGVSELEGVQIRSFRTVSTKGFDTLVHSAKVTYDIIRHNRADIVHIQNGGNSIFGAIIRLFGKKTFLSQDGLDWQRDKWPLYAKIYLYLSSYLTAHVHSAVIFDNVFARAEFAKRFNKTYDFVPFGADVPAVAYTTEPQILSQLGVSRGEYLLFVGRFIPDKGLHWLIPAFEKVITDKKLILVGGSPNPSQYERDLKQTTDPRIIFPGFLYGQDVHVLMDAAYAYVQPSAIEGLSPVILEAAYLGAPIICADIPQNRYAMGEHALYFKSGDSADLRATLTSAINSPKELNELGQAGSRYVTERFSWDAVVQQHERIFSRQKLANDRAWRERLRKRIEYYR